MSAARPANSEGSTAPSRLASDFRRLVGPLITAKGGDDRQTAVLQALGLQLLGLRHPAKAPPAGPLGVVLDPGARKELQRRYGTTADAVTQARYEMVLLAGDGRAAKTIAHQVGCSPDTVWRVLRRYQTLGPDGVLFRSRQGRRSRMVAG